VLVCWMSAWARVCGSGDGVLRAIVVDDRALRAADPSGVRCARSVESMWASEALVVTYLVSAFAWLRGGCEGIIPHPVLSVLLALNAPLSCAPHPPSRSPSTTRAAPSVSLHCARMLARCARHTCMIAKSQCVPNPVPLHAVAGLLMVRRGLRA
jgi:hypothetical protein